MAAINELGNIVKEYCAGNKEKFEEIYKLSYKSLYTTIIYIVKNEEVANDILQEVYIEIIKNIGQLKDSDSFLSWATVIAKRKCYAYLKKKKKFLISESDEDGEDTLDSIADNEAFIPESILQDKEKQRLMREIINELSDMQRICIIGFYYNEQKQEEIAEELQIPINTVKTHLSRAKAKIKKSVLDLEENKGTRLYSIAPFMLLFFKMEAEAALVPAVSRPLTEVMNTHLETNIIKSVGKEKKLLWKPVVITTTISLVVTIATVSIIGSKKTVVEENIGIGQAYEKVIDEESNTENDTVTEVNEELEVNQIEKKMKLKERLVVPSSEYESYGYAIGGAIPVKKNGLWGAINYDMEEIVPCKYSKFVAAPNKLGYFVLANVNNQETTKEIFGETITLSEEQTYYYLFDNQGNVVIEVPYPILASGEYFMITHDNQISYHLNDGKYILTTVNIEESLLSPNGFYDGKATVYKGEYLSDNENNVKLDVGTLIEDGTVSWNEYSGNIGFNAGNYLNDNSIANEDINLYANGTGDDVYMPRTPISTCNNGYYIMYNPWLLAGSLELVAEDHSFVSSINYFNFIQSDDEIFVNQNAFNEENYCKYFYHDGDKFFNYGSKMVIRVGEKDVLVDLSKVPGMTSETMTEDIIVAVYDCIEMNDSKYWLIQADDGWGYMDLDGNLLKVYDHASPFGNGHALIIEDGNAFLINEEFEIIQELGVADSVGYTYDLFVILRDGNRIYYECVFN